jgi:DnaJ like chaperone protein
VSLWSRLLEGVKSLPLGGPLGDVLSSVGRGLGIGPEIDGGKPDATKQIAFTIAVVALGAKMARADGVVSPSEIRAFREVFHVPPEELANMSYVFDLARRHPAGYESYARQVAKLFPPRNAVLEDLLGGLLHIAMADGVVLQEEDAYLRRVAEIFGFDDADYRRIRASHGAMPAADEPAADPYAILGIMAETEEKAVKSAWRRLVRENHPDAAIAAGLPQEFIDLATEKLAHINAAYDRIAKDRAFK